MSEMPLEDLPPEARALLETIAGPESAGSYNVIYGGSQFDDFTDHPRQYVTIQSGPNAGQRSSAAGKYQFLGSTWDDISSRHGLNDFSPQSQDRAAWALAQEEYQRDTGRSLGADLAAGDLSRVPGSLKNQWTSMPGGIEQGITGSAFASAFTQALGKASQPPPPLPRERPERGAIAASGGLMGGKLPAIGPTGGPALGAINRAAPPIMRGGGSPGWWSNPLATARNALGNSGLKMPQLGPAAQRQVGMSLMTLAPGRRMIAQTLMGGTRQPAPVQTAAQVQSQPSFNPSNHSAAQLAAASSGQSTFVSSPGAVSEPVRAMNGNLRYTY